MALLFAISATLVSAEDFGLKYQDATPVSLHTAMVYEGNGEHLTAIAKNVSGVPIPHAKICIRSASLKKGCLFELWNTVVWAPDAELTWDLTSQRKVSNLFHEATLVAFDGVLPAKLIPARAPSRFDAIRKVYVDELGGNTGPILRDQIIAALVIDGRFTAVEKPDLADAFIRGRSDSQDESTKVTSDGKGTAGAVFGTVITRGKTTSVTQTVVSEKVSLRLTIASGEAIWAWDGTKPCNSTKARCAIEDLTANARQ
jgi:hypothetical protein